MLQGKIDHGQLFEFESLSTLNENGQQRGNVGRRGNKTGYCDVEGFEDLMRLCAKK